MYEPDPPEATAVNVADSPPSIVTGETDTDRAVTVTVTGFEVTMTSSWSVTWSSNDQVPGVERTPVDAELLQSDVARLPKAPPGG